MSCLEIYNEVIRDLLHPDSDGNSSNLKIVEGRDRAPSIPGLVEKVVTTTEQVKHS